MKIVKASFQLTEPVDPKSIMERLETYGRICYKSESKISGDSADGFIERIIKSGHESVIEHEKITVKIICDRGVSHEIVRHRIASYSQESTRYCNYARDRFGSELTFIEPVFWQEGSEEYTIWKNQMQSAEDSYIKLISAGVSAEQARSVLPNSLKTELVMTMNLREWRHFFKLRTSKSAHPQMREICVPLALHFKQLLPVIFGDI